METKLLSRCEERTKIIYNTSRLQILTAKEKIKISQQNERMNLEEQYGEFGNRVLNIGNQQRKVSGPTEQTLRSGAGGWRAQVKSL